MLSEVRAGFIAEGRHRNVYVDSNNPDKVIKIEKPVGVVHLPEKLLLGSANQRELKVYDTLPGELRQYFPKICKVIESGALEVSRPTDFDGTFSQTVGEYGRVNNGKFWDHIEFIYRSFLENKLWLFDVFRYGSNVLVVKETPDSFKPFIADFKRNGWLHGYPFQPDLAFNFRKRAKMSRGYKRFKELYGFE